MSTLASLLASYTNHMGKVAKDGDIEAEPSFEDAIRGLVKGYMPSGSGFDCGTEFDFDRSTDSKLVFHTSFHHMDEGGGYSGWTDHTITVRPSFNGLTIKVSGRNKDGICDYIGDTFYEALMRKL